MDQIQKVIRNHLGSYQTTWSEKRAALQPNTEERKMDVVKTTK